MALGKSILVVDDNEAVLRLTKRYLDAEYDVVTILGGREAWKWLQDNQVDVLITDMDMPELNGIGLARLARENDGTMAIILQSGTLGDLSRGEREDLQKDGVICSFLQKPVTKNDLQHAIRLALNI